LTSDIVLPSRILKVTNTRDCYTPIQWVPGALSVGVKRPVREAEHTPPSSGEVKNAWKYTSTPPIRLHGVVLSLKSTETTFTFYITFNVRNVCCLTLDMHQIMYTEVHTILPFSYCVKYLRKHT
jgi:hypothetical protein